jgi:hypothetical protein
MQKNKSTPAHPGKALIALYRPSGIPKYGSSFGPQWRRAERCINKTSRIATARRHSISVLILLFTIREIYRILLLFIKLPTMSAFGTKQTLIKI